MNRAMLFSAVSLPSARVRRWTFFVGLLTGAAISAIVAAAAFIVWLGP